ncbi:hypothetical protein EHQ12_16160 [Leptospira gomenensis]|uniref:Uncharacterized protein n=1 Tax=Leptospira gomenensis TaxID=2484974 RepID=A0A5F1Y6I3_9LEPT|nr:DUF6714 family protein [Leptospira gomenensis]TGK27547.1 hypothetical protein EHQ17_19450 [Leptospira gomenensis]TGK34983.1 hypothetical protein EHQ12_16160 [Leptospira gomenensis]TGK42628.1 hypothetical protein EHQ07_14550 [Leptospira gomenensis]TGK65791.1 hypothetical protein EHQ13_04655 [Leptospira gomenensis]
MSDDLIQQIESAFQQIPHPGDEHLVTNPSDPESQLIARHFAGKRDWRGLGSDFLNEPCGALSFLSDMAFRFYLPAFMIADIQGALEWDDPSVRLCWSHTASGGEQRIGKVWGGGTIKDRAEDCHRHFDSRQVSAIIAYLLWKLVSNHDEDLCITEALENYWLKREED